jgi:hypothetical protein
MNYPGAEFRGITPPFMIPLGYAVSPLFHPFICHANAGNPKGGAFLTSIQHWRDCNPFYSAPLNKGGTQRGDFMLFVG